MANINVLPKSVAELIAAGEVVERPASVIKELTENAVDAGASAVTVEIKNGGATYIRVTDNGCGIAREDVPTAFLPHATSKIKTAEDLGGIFTLGFRGEALPSIAAVARVSLLTRTADESVGTSYAVEGGQAGEPEDAGCPAGSTFAVRDLFYNMPARRKFMKKDVTEGNFAADTVAKTALSHPEIKFTFVRDGKRVFSTPGNGDLFAAVRAVFGAEVTDMLLPCEYEYGNIRVKGYVSKPAGNRPNRSMQYFFVNGRYVRIPAAAPALDRAYKNTIMVGKFPMCFLALDLPFNLTDVNVHPAKTEIRFSDEAGVYEAVFYAARTALARGDTARPRVTLTGAAGLPDESAPPAPQTKPAPAPQPRPAQTPAPQTKPAAVGVSVREPVPARPPQAARTAAAVYEEPQSLLSLRDDGIERRLRQEGIAPYPTREEEPAPAPAPQAPARDFSREFAALSKKEKTEKERLPVRVVGEAFGTYIIAEQGDRLYVIDKHAAHERMIFNALSQTEEAPAAQMLLSPVAAQLSGREYAAVIENLEVFSAAGYEIEDFGGSSVIVRACPVQLTREDVVSLVRELAGKLAQGDYKPTPEKLDWIKNSTACRAAVKAGDALKPAETQAFVERLLADENVKYCPHGRPVLYELTRAELEKQFGRVQ